VVLVVEAVVLLPQLQTKMEQQELQILYQEVL
jgi:hypothetical protein